MERFTLLYCVNKILSGSDYYYFFKDSFEANLELPNLLPTSSKSWDYSLDKGQGSKLRKWHIIII